MITAMLVMLVIGAALGGLLAIASKVLHVETDVREEEVNAMLPGYNCGACGYPGCSGLAHAIISGEVSSFPCKVCKAEQKEKIISYLASTPGPDGTAINIKG